MSTSATPEGGGAPGRKALLWAESVLNESPIIPGNVYVSIARNFATALEADRARRDAEYTERLRVAVEALENIGYGCNGVANVARAALARLKEEPTT